MIVKRPRKSNKWPTRNYPYKFTVMEKKGAKVKIIDSHGTVKVVEVGRLTKAKIQARLSSQRVKKGLQSLWIARIQKKVQWITKCQKQVFKLSQEELELELLINQKDSRISYKLWVMNWERGTRNKQRRRGM